MGAQQRVSQQHGGQTEVVWTSMDPMEAADWLWYILSKSAANASIRSAKLCGVTDSAAVMYAFTQMVF